ncbi:carbohydrate-binding protein [Sediminivirga luteola]|uniref:Chitin-binding type-3 domain-containing protein n=1 Tax=Sediminivirga luteola TaxID=1774748 RepID=A0A8J2TX05_9MICO|nr:carbohydrate-binding protein [Sediminivirga luteola]GGA10561.1 hypothetical protein GCM10011333_11710 [Sediminivirga luteola]
MDLENATPAELEEISDAAGRELARRQTVLAVQREVRAVLQGARDHGAISTPAPGAQWVQPAGAHDAYLAGDEVTHEGRRWVSMADANVWEPGVSGWRPLAEDGSYGEWVQPARAHDAYRDGDVVLYDGRVYRSLIDGNAWSPDVYPGGWLLITEHDDAAGEDDDHQEPDPGPLTWEPGRAYSIGELVVYSGVVYRVVQAHQSAEHWLPPEQPALYQPVEE